MLTFDLDCHLEDKRPGHERSEDENEHPADVDVVFDVRTKEEAGARAGPSETGEGEGPEKKSGRVEDDADERPEEDPTRPRTRRAARTSVGCYSFGWIITPRTSAMRTSVTRMRILRARVSSARKVPNPRDPTCPWSWRAAARQCAQDRSRAGSRRHGRIF